ncbi:MAG TPA: hypothetical protein VN030_13335 [Cellvibrio sp.]|nr:hypothetical protein [Cellvibrio sp.]
MQYFNARSFKSLCLKALCSLALIATVQSSWAASSSVLEAEIAGLKQQFAGTPRDVSRAVHSLEWTGISNPELFDDIATRLEAGYGGTSKYALELNSWLVKSLALSGNEKYLPLMNTIAARKDIKKLNRHTINSLENFAKFQRWNPIIAANNETAKTPQELNRLRTLNMLNADDGELMERGAKIISRQYMQEKELIDTINSVLLANYQTTDSDKKQAVEWMSKILGESGKHEYKTTLDKIAGDSSASRKIRNDAAKYSAILGKS